MRWLIGFLLCACLNCFAGVQEDIAADMRASRWDAAGDKLQQVLVKHADHALAHYWLAQVRERQGRIGEAASELRLAKDWDPTLEFAGDRDVLTRLETRVGATHAEPSNPGAAVEQPKQQRARPEATQALAPQIGAAESRAKAMLTQWFGWLAAVLAVGAVLGVVIRKRYEKRAAAKAVEQERERMRSSLDGVKEELRDAERAVRGRGQALGLEGQMSMEDRLKGGIDDANRATGALPGLQSFEAQRALVTRLKQLAADGRGEAAAWRADQRRKEARQQAPRVGRTVVVSDDLDGGLAPGFATGGVIGMAQGSQQQRLVAVEDLAPAGAQTLWPAEERRTTRVVTRDVATDADNDVDVRGSGKGGWDGGSDKVERQETREAVRDEPRASNEPSNDAAATVDTVGTGPSMD